jgi:hypothetical protein
VFSKYINRQTSYKKKIYIPGPIDAGHYPANRLFVPSMTAEIVIGIVQFKGGNLYFLGGNVQFKGGNIQFVGGKVWLVDGTVQYETFF